MPGPNVEGGEVRSYRAERTVEHRRYAKKEWKTRINDEAAKKLANYEATKFEAEASIEANTLANQTIEEAADRNNV